LLSAFFCLWTIFLHLKGRLPWAAFGCYLLALLCKPAAVVLPLMLLALDHWGRGIQFKKAARAALPWLAAAAPICLVTQWIQHADPGVTVAAWLRAFVAADALAFYMAKLVLPVDLVFDYGRTPAFVLEHAWGYATWIAPAALAATLFLMRRRYPWLVAAGLVSLAALLPVLGLVPFVFQNHSTTADRYLYLALFGLALALACWIDSAPAVSGWIGAFLLILAYLSFSQTGVWRNTVTLMGHELAIDPTCVIARIDLGQALLAQGQPREAADEFRQALARDPYSVEANNDLGYALLRLGSPRDALAPLQTAEGLRPGDPTVRVNLGNALYECGSLPQAARQYDAAIRLSPNDARGYRGLALVAIKQRQFAQAAADYVRVLALKPDDSVARTNLTILQNGIIRGRQSSK
jgi:tetratricopeptide (TPR) repeat protein